MQIINLLPMAAAVGMTSAAALAQRDLVCPAGYAPASGLPQQVNVVPYEVQINQYFGDNTIIDVGGVTININNAPTSLVTTFTATSTVTVTGATSLPTAFLLSPVNPVAARKRDITGSFVGADGAIVTDCRSASTFSLTNGQLASAGSLVSAEEGAESIVFAVSSTPGSITTTFTSFEGTLVWSNAAFSNGVATFFTANGVLNAALGEIASAPSQSLDIVPAGFCGGASNNTTNTVSSGVLTTSTGLPTTSTGVVSTTSTGSSTTSTGVVSTTSTGSSTTSTGVVSPPYTNGTSTSSSGPSSTTPPITQVLTQTICAAIPNTQFTAGVCSCVPGYTGSVVGDLLTCVAVPVVSGVVSVVTGLPVVGSVLAPVVSGVTPVVSGVVSVLTGLPIVGTSIPLLGGL